jgi:hypothetical protein
MGVITFLIVLGVATPRSAAFGGFGLDIGLDPPKGEG